MSIIVNSGGGVGNHMFPYITARIFAEKYKLKLLTPLKNPVLKFKPEPSYSPEHQVGLKGTKMNHNHYDSTTGDLRFHGRRPYIFQGYFQHTDYLNKNISLVKSFVEEYYDNHDYSEYNITDRDALILLRVGSYIHHQGDSSEIIHPDFYVNCLSEIKPEKVFVLAWPLNDPYLTLYLQKLKEGLADKYQKLEIKDPVPKIVLVDNKGNEAKDFYMPNEFSDGKVICGNSTYHWWSLFFSNRMEFYVPKYFGYYGPGRRICHGGHIKDLWDIRGCSIVRDNDFVDVHKWGKLETGAEYQKVLSDSEGREWKNK